MQTSQSSFQKTSTLKTFKSEQRDLESCDSKCWFSLSNKQITKHLTVTNKYVIRKICSVLLLLLNWNDNSFAEMTEERHVIGSHVPIKFEKE
jgi:hypothetical protein